MLVSKKKNKKKVVLKEVIDDRPRIKVRLNDRTIMYVKDKSALKIWKERYPKLKVIE